MRRLGFALLAVALALAVPVAFLVARALEGVQLERDVRHEAVAARIFDEMERALSELLQREEARPFAHYAFYPPGSGERSPLSQPPDEPFVVGHFQIDPDGSVHTPLRPRDLAAAEARGDWSPAAPAAARAEATLELVRASLRGDAPEPPPAPASAAPLAQAPGTTRPLAKQERLAEAKQAADRDETTVYDALARLNRGAGERQQKLTAERSAQAFRGAPESASELESREQDLAAFADGRAREEAAPAAADPVPGEPMLGRAAGAQRLVLYRTVLVERQGYRQGLVLDTEALGRWLEARVIAPSGLSGVAHAAFAPAGAPVPPDPPGDAYLFQHRFAEPFDALAVTLALAPLPGVLDTAPIYALALVAFLAGTLGLFAVYRSARLTVDYAERRSHFVSAVTHELKTPLTAIRMYGEMLRDGVVESERKRAEYYRTITDESERLSRLIDNVLEFSRLEKGTRQWNVRAGELGPVLEEAVARLRPHAERLGFRLRCHVEPGLPPVRFDRDALLQIVFNLIDNALKYARGAARPEVELEARRSAGGVALSVRDWGPGVPQRHLAQIFEAFYRGQDELTRTSPGTGLGLALVRELAERMGAAVSGANTPDGGLCVRIAFRTPG